MHKPEDCILERPVEPDGATVVDGSKYDGGLITAPNFGCVLWEENQGDKGGKSLEA